MDSDTRQRFTRQIADWAGQYLTHGRYPFRRAQAWPELLTSTGVQHPPLVLWINRESFMAGGLLLLPGRQAEECFADGRACAEALGLKHFVTWERQQIRLWECTESPSLVRTLPLPTDREPTAADFRELLEQLLHELKLLAVLGAIPPEQLSPYYLANLCRAPLLAARDELVAAYRAARAEGDDQHSDALRLAGEKGWLALLRLLALSARHQIPDAVQPEKLELAMELALPYLSDSLRAALQPTAMELPLPHPVAVRFLHLFRRLGQLRWCQQPARAACAINVLLRHEEQSLGLCRRPEGEITPGALLVNPTAVDIPSCHEVFQYAQLRGLSVLLRELRQQPPALSTTLDICALTPREPLAHINGVLLAASGPLSATQREALKLRLRVSWPNRRIQVPAQAPRWLWEALHLLGCTAEDGRVELSLPDAWLDAAYGEVLMELIGSQFTLLCLRRHQEPFVSLSLVRRAAPADAEVLVCDSEQNCQLRPWHELQHEARSAWLPSGAQQPAAARRPSERTSRRGEDESAEIIAAVFADGLPRFPEHYLYDLFRPQLQTFEISGPLSIRAAFLGSFELRDSAGAAFTVEGEETARALLLASHGGEASISLPLDRSLTATILDRYLADLDRLRQQLLRATFARRDNSQTARAWARRIWASLPLPPWEELPE